MAEFKTQADTVVAYWSNHLSTNEFSPQKTD